MSFSLPNVFSLATRENCMSKFKNLPVPKQVVVPKDTAAVLVPVIQNCNSPALIYTVRSAYVRSHSGQISFPGGKTDNKETPIETALRETEEEIGLPQSKVEVWGHGPAFPGRDGKIMITPVVGAIMDFNLEDLRINPKEVSEVFTVPLQKLCDPKNQFHTQFRNGYILPVFVAEQYKIWGITAYLTHAFLSCLLPRHVYKNDWTKRRISFKDLSQNKD